MEMLLSFLSNAIAILGNVRKLPHPLYVYDLSDAPASEKYTVILSPLRLVLDHISSEILVEQTEDTMFRSDHAL